MCNNVNLVIRVPENWIPLFDGLATNRSATVRDLIISGAAEVGIRLTPPEDKRKRKEKKKREVQNVSSN